MSARREPPTALIAGAGIGGLAAALALDAHGVRCRIFEAAREIRPLGVGINLLPHAVRVLARLGLDERLATQAVETARARRTSTATASRSGASRAGGPPATTTPQFSVHRGVLQLACCDAVLRAARARRDRHRPPRPSSPSREDADGVTRAARTPRRRRDRRPGRAATCWSAPTASTPRSARQLDPDEGGAALLRTHCCGARSRGREPFLDGRTMIMAGHQDQKFVCYPIEPGPRRRPARRSTGSPSCAVPAMRRRREDWNRGRPIETTSAPRSPTGASTGSTCRR